VSRPSSVAIHEAGHAAASVFLGKSIGHASIRSHGKTLGRVSPGKSVPARQIVEGLIDPGRRLDSLAWFRRIAVSALAGPFVEAAMGGASVRAALRGGGVDLAIVSDAADTATLGGTETKTDLFDQWTRDAQELILLDGYQRAVWEVAQALEAQTALLGSRVERIVRSATGRRLETSRRSA
jgi:hypothetical protein